jgi:serine/threonine protein kinase
MRKLLSLGYSRLQRWSWLLRDYGRLQEDLRVAHGALQVRPVLARRWHRGSKYFSGVDASGERLFLKLDGDSRLLENEVNACVRLQRTVSNSEHFPNMRFFNLMGNYRVTAMEWLEGETLSSLLRKNPPEEQLRRVMREMAAILGELNRAGIVHRDFTPDNLLVSTAGSRDSISVVLIDFAFAAIDGAAPQDRLVSLHDLRDLCHGYKAEEYRWDDAYSCLRIFEEIRGASGVEDAISLTEARNRIGALTFSFDAAAAERERVGCFAAKTASGN